MACRADDGTRGNSDSTIPEGSARRCPRPVNSFGRDYGPSRHPATGNCTVSVGEARRNGTERIASDGERRTAAPPPRIGCVDRRRDWWRGGSGLTRSRDWGGFFGTRSRDRAASHPEALMKQIVTLIAVLAFARAAAGQGADDYRGGWRTDAGEPHTYEFSIRGTTVRGIYCTYCADATTLAFVDGTFGPDGIRFEVTHVNADGSTAYKDKALAKFSQGRLVVTGTSGARGGATFERVLIKDPRG